MCGGGVGPGGLRGGGGGELLGAWGLQAVLVLLERVNGRIEGPCGWWQ